MKVSVVICTYSQDIYDDFCEAVASIRAQTYDDIEIVLVVDGNDPLCEQVIEDFGDSEDVTIHCNEENIGLSGSRNAALSHVTGDVVALIDDDAIASEHWVEELVSVYEDSDAIAVGGRMTPRWVAGRPSFLPEEFYWLVGVNRPGFAEPGEEVRNTFGSNLSVRTEVLRELDGFERKVGRHGEANLQAHETEFCVRMREAYGQGVIYNPDAIVEHKVFDYRTSPRWLLERAFWQGYSKRAMEKIVTDDSTDKETEFLGELVTGAIPSRIRSFVTGPSIEKFVQFCMLFALTGIVGVGYLYGIIKWRHL